MESVSCESWDDDALSDAAESCGSGPAGAGEVVAISSGDALDHADVAQPAELAREPMSGRDRRGRQQVGAADAGDVGARILQSVQQGVVGRIEEVDPLDGPVVDGARLGEAVEGANPGGEVVDGGEILQIAAIAAERISRRSIRL